MTLYHGASFIIDGLTMHLDAGNLKSYANENTYIINPTINDPYVDMGTYRNPWGIYADSKMRVITTDNDGAGTGGVAGVYGGISNLSFTYTATLFGLDVRNPRVASGSLTNFVYLVDTNSSTIYYIPEPYTALGTSNSTFVLPSSTGPVYGIYYMPYTGITTTDAAAYIACFNTTTSTIVKLDYSRVLTDPWVTLSSGVQAWSITCDLVGNVYTGNSDGTISQITPAGVLTQVWATVLSGYNIVGLAVNSTGTQMYASTTNNYIHLIDIPTATVTQFWTQMVYTDFRVTSPGLYIDRFDNLYVLPAVGQNVIPVVSQISPQGVFTESYALLNPTNQSQYLTIDYNGTLYISNYGANTITRILPTREVVYDLSNQGNDGYFINHVATLTTDMAPMDYSNNYNGYFYIADNFHYTYTKYIYVNKTSPIPFTLCAWINQSSNSAAGSGANFNIFNFSVANFGYTFAANNSAVYFNTFNYTNGIIPITSTLYSTPTLNLFDTWNYVCVTVNATGNTASLYLNGNKLSTTGTVDNTAFKYANSSYASDIAIMSQFGSVSGAGATFSTYDRILTDSEIIQNFIATRSRFGV